MIKKPTGYFVYIFLFALYLLTSFYRTAQLKKMPGYNPHDDTGLFWSEAAFQYRFAEMVAEEGRLPSVDYRAQHPEGVNVFEEFTVLMELTSGYLYRFVVRHTGMPFHVFIIYFIAFFSSLTVFPVFFTSSMLAGSIPAGFISVIWYILARVNFLRIVKGGFEYEIFALPFIAAGFYLFLRSINSRNIYHSIAAAVSFSIALISWHFSNFFLTVFIACLCVIYYISPEDKKTVLARGLGVIAVAFIITGLLFPVLRSKYFLCSAGMVLCYGFGIAYLVKKYMPAVKMQGGIICILSCILLYVLCMLLFPKYGAEYRHVIDLFKYKILYLNQKPDNPALLTFDAASLWEGAFNQPDIPKTIYIFSTLLITGGLIWLNSFKKFWKRVLTSEENILFCMTGCSIVLYILVERLHIFLGFFLCLYAGRWLYAFGGKYRTILRGVLAVCVMFEAFEFIAYGNPGINTPMRSLYTKIVAPKRETAYALSGDDIRLASWIRANTGSDDVFLAPFEYAPLILTYTGRQIVLHPKFETKQVRDKYRDFVNALYSGEEKLYRLCADYKADYFMYKISMLFDRTTEGIQYLAHYPDITTGKAVYKFHFKPETLKYFSLVYETRSCRIFRISAQGAKERQYTPLYDAVYDQAVFNPAGASLFDVVAAARIFQRVLTKDDYVNYAASMFGNRQLKDAEYYLKLAAATGIPDYRIPFILGEVQFSLNNIDTALEYFRKTIEIEPAFAPVYFDLAAAFNYKEQYKDAVTAAGKALQLSEREVPEGYVILGMAYEGLKEYAKALEAFNNALALNPALGIARQKISQLKSKIRQ